jgi:hypothetical protein
MMNKSTCAVLLTIATLSTALVSIDVHAEGKRFHRDNAAGRHTAGAVHRNTGPNGGTVANGRAVKTDGEGNGVAVRGSKITGPEGATAERAAKNTRSADGSATHASGFNASGVKGTVDSQGSASRDADGNVIQARTTTATGANGNSYNGSTTYSKDTGVVHTGTCTDAAGQVIACPR